MSRTPPPKLMQIPRPVKGHTPKLTHRDVLNSCPPQLTTQCDYSDSYTRTASSRSNSAPRSHCNLDCRHSTHRPWAQCADNVRSAGRAPCSDAPSGTTVCFSPAHMAAPISSLASRSSCNSACCCIVYLCRCSRSSRCRRCCPPISG